MKRNMWMALGMAFFALHALAMAAPNFSGSWVQDSAKSDRVPEPLWLTRAAPTTGRGGRAGGPGGRGNAADSLTVQQDANTLQATDGLGAVRNYRLDGKAYPSATETGIQKAEVTASLHGDTLVIGTTRPYGGMPGNVTLQVQEVWSLSADGKVLTITTTQSSPAVEKTFKQIYNRK